MPQRRFIWLGRPLRQGAQVLLLPVAALAGWLVHTTGQSMPAWWGLTGLGLCILGFTLYALHTRGLAREVSRSIGTVSTERARRLIAEKHQHHRETEFQLLYNRSPVMMHTVDEEGRFLGVNQAWVDKTGYAHEEVIGRSYAMIHTENSARKADLLIQDFWKRGYAHNVSFQWLCKDGRIIDVVQDSNVTLDKNGRKMSLSVVRDITEQRKAEHALHQTEQERQLILESISEGVLYLSRDLRIMWGNDAVTPMAGVSAASELVGKHCYEIIQGGDRPCPECPCLRAMQTGQKTYIERHGRDGRVYMVNANPVRGPGGKIIGAVEVKSDITELKFTQERLQQFKTTLDLTLDSVFMFNPVNLRFFYVNAGATRMMGYTREELRRMTPLDIKPEYSEESFRRILEPLQAGRQSSLTFQTVHRRKDGSDLPVEIFLQYVAPPNRSGRFVAIVRDISAHKEAEARLQRALDEVQHSNEDLEQFAYVASHDLQEPLRMVTSYVELLAHRYGEKLDEDAREYIGFATRGAKLMQELIQDLLEYSRVGTRGKPFELQDLNEVMQTVRSNLQGLIGQSGAVIEVGDLPAVTADRMQLIRLLQNLLSNAVKFRSERTPRVGVWARRIEDAWELSVEDNGIGIDPKYFDRIFAVFQRLHSRDQYPGTGMGLAICKRIVERHGGRLGVRSEPGRGTCFSFTIPDHEVSDEDFQPDATGGNSAGRGQPGRRSADEGSAAGKPHRQPPSRGGRWRGGDGVPATGKSLSDLPSPGPDPAGPESPPQGRAGGAGGTET
jgi:PAS domain S-box-containing protein